MTNPAGGPNTQAGKEVARWNATRHGIRSPAPVVPGLEKVEDWEEHRDGVLESLSPEGHLELVLAERVAVLSWRLHRVTRYEQETIALSQEKFEEDLLKERQSFSRSTSEPAHLQDVRMHHEVASKIHRLLKRLPTLQGKKRLSSEDAGSVLLEVWDQVDEEVGPEKLEIPGIPQALDPELLLEYDFPWTVSLVREGVSVLAQFAGETPEELLEHLTEEARRKAIRAKSRADEVEWGLRDMSRERLLPDENTLEKITRYEAHLSPALPSAARVGGFANEAQRCGRSFGPPRRAGPRKLKLPYEPPVVDSPLEHVQPVVPAGQMVLIILILVGYLGHSAPH